MTGSSSLCIEVRILPLDGAHVSHEQFNFCCPLPHLRIHAPVLCVHVVVTEGALVQVQDDVLCLAGIVWAVLISDPQPNDVSPFAIDESVVV
jgi:hypothetical protein